MHCILYLLLILTFYIIYLIYFLFRSKIRFHLVSFFHSFLSLFAEVFRLAGAHCRLRLEGGCNARQIFAGSGKQAGDRKMHWENNKNAGAK